MDDINQLISIEEHFNSFTDALDLFVDTSRIIEGRIDAGASFDFNIGDFIKEENYLQQEYAFLISLINDLSFIEVYSNPHKPINKKINLYDSIVDPNIYLDLDKDYLVLSKKDYLILPVDASKLLTKTYKRDFRRFLDFVEKLIK